MLLARMNEPGHLAKMLSSCITDDLCIGGIKLLTVDVNIFIVRRAFIAMCVQSDYLEIRLSLQIAF